MTPLNFTAPPPSKTPGGRHLLYMTAEVQEQLRDRQGEWALLLEATGSSTRNAVYAYCRRHPEFETTCRIVDHSEDKAPIYDVYVRYVGE